MITDVGTISLSSVTSRDAVFDSNTGYIIYVESTGNTLRKYDPSTQSQVGGNITTLSTPAAVCMINSSSAAVFSSGVTTVDIIEISSGYRTNLSGGTALSSTVKSQQCAGDTSTATAISISATARKVVKVNNGAVTSLTIQSDSSAIMNCCILKSSGRWLIGGQFGKIYEIDASGNIVDQLDIGLLDNAGQLGPVSGSLLSTTVEYMSYDNNLLLVSTDGAVILLDWSTKTVLHRSNSNNNTLGNCLCAASSGITLSSRPNTSSLNNTVWAWDFTNEPIKMNENSDMYFLAATTATVAVGINPNNNYGFNVQGNTQINVFTVAPRYSTTRTVTVPNTAKFRLIWIDDTVGNGNTKILLDTFGQSPATYRIPTGKTIKEIVKVGTGTNATWGYGEFTT